MRTRAVQLLVNEALPPELRNYERPLDARDVGDLMHKVALTSPGAYASILKRIGDIGRNAAYWQGESMGLDDLEDIIDVKPMIKEMHAEVAAATHGMQDPKEKRKTRETIWLKWSTKIERAAMEAGKLKRNSVADSVVSGARGKPLQLRAMLATPGVFENNSGGIVPVFAERSYSRGVSPAEWLAGTFGARASTVSTKRATARGGFWGKMLVQVAAPLMVTTDDCGTSNGIDLDPDDSSLRNRFLAQGIGKLPGGAQIDRKVLAEIRNNHKPVIVRSAMTCEAKKGVCAKCLGAMPDGSLAPKGYAAGVTAAQAASEPVTQGGLNCLVLGTLVRMADFSVRKIEDIKVGEMVLGADTQGNTFPVRVTATWDQGVQPVQEYVFKMGATRQLLSVTCTEKHEILSNKKSSNCKDEELNALTRKIPAGDKRSGIAAVLPVTCKPLARGKRESLAPVLGVFLGDGIRVTIKGPPKFSCADPSLIHDLNAGVLATHALKALKCKRSHDYRVIMRDYNPKCVPQDTRTGRFCKGQWNTLKKLLFKCGFKNKYAFDKTLPTDVWKWDDTSILALIAGYLATDGSLGYNGAGQSFVSFGSTSKTLLDQLKDIMAVRFCVYTGKVTRTGKAGTGARKHDIYALSVTRSDMVQKLLKLLPKIPGIKARNQTQLLKKPSPTVFNDVFYRAPRVSVKARGEMQCHDLSVAHPDELFVLANGLIVSNTKHVSGTAKEKKSYSGIEWLERFVQVPDNFPDRAPLAETEGRVLVEPAPQGGNYVKIGDRTHYVPQHLEVKVKSGDMVEAGDVLSDGIVRPDDVVRLRGIGEGRRYYATRLKQMLDDGGTKADARNTEVIARAAVDHVRVADFDDFDEGVLPDDVVPYEKTLGRDLPEDAADTDPEKAVGKYLYKPVLHYTIGTRLTPKMSQHLKKVGIGAVTASAKSPGFAPTMQRLQTQSFANDDWLASMHTSYLGKQLAQGAQRAQDTNIRKNIHFAPRLAFGENFGTNIEQTGEF